MLRLLVAALTLVGGTLVPSPASAQDGQLQPTAWHDGACTDNVGITIVVDFQQLGGGVNVRCAPGPVSSGLDALDQADIAWEGVQRFPGVVCRLAGLPGPDTEACINTPPGNAYWGYWIAPRGGNWCYSTIGAGNRTPPPGSVEGWSFSSGTAQPPRFDVPAAIDGQPPNPVRSGDCGSPAAGQSTTTTTQPPATSTTTTITPAPEVTDPNAPAPPPPPTTARPRSTTTTGDPPGGTVATTTTTTSVASGSTTTSASSTSTSSTSSTTTSTSSTTSSTSTSVATSTSVESTAPLGTVDLSDDGQDGGGFGAATAAGIVSVGGLAGTAIWIARRRRLAP